MGEQVRITGAAVELPGGVAVRFMRTLRLPETGRIKQLGDDPGEVADGKW